MVFGQDVVKRIIFLLNGGVALCGLLDCGKWDCARVFSLEILERLFEFYL